MDDDGIVMHRPRRPKEVAPLTACRDLASVVFTSRVPRWRRRGHADGNRWNDARRRWTWLSEELGVRREVGTIWPSLLPRELRQVLCEMLLRHKRDEMETLAGESFRTCSRREHK